jgi:hypothetical protein
VGGALGGGGGTTTPTGSTTDAGGTTTQPGAGSALTGQPPADTPEKKSQSLTTASVDPSLLKDDLPSYAGRVSTRDLSSSALPPLLASGPSQLTAVQAPLLALAQSNGSGSSFNLMGLRGGSLPGLLVVLATALVAAVGAGNLHHWRTRLAKAQVGGSADD